jgi:hypothetical protein
MDLQPHGLSSAASCSSTRSSASSAQYEGGMQSVPVRGGHAIRASTRGACNPCQYEGGIQSTLVDAWRIPGRYIFGGIAGGRHGYGRELLSCQAVVQAGTLMARSTVLECTNTKELSTTTQRLLDVPEVRLTLPGGAIRPVQKAT